MARVLEGPVPAWKLFGQPGTGNGAGGQLVRPAAVSRGPFRVRFPFGTVTLRDKDVPLEVEITGWSPFEPGDADNASLPVAALEYRFTNRSAAAVEAVFSLNARNFMAIRRQPAGGASRAGRLRPLGRAGQGQAAGRKGASRRRSAIRR